MGEINTHDSWNTCISSQTLLLQFMYVLHILACLRKNPKLLHIQISNKNNLIITTWPWTETECNRHDSYDSMKPARWYKFLSASPSHLHQAPVREHHSIPSPLLFQQTPGCRSDWGRKVRAWISFWCGVRTRQDASSTSQFRHSLPVH